MNQLEEARKNINAIDQKMAKLFEQRMAIATRMGVLKGERGQAVWDEEREAAKLRNRESMLRDRSLTKDVARLFETILELSCQRQEEQRRDRA